MSPLKVLPLKVKDLETSKANFNPHPSIYSIIQRLETNVLHAISGNLNSGDMLLPLILENNFPGELPSRWLPLKPSVATNALATSLISVAANVCHRCRILFSPFLFVVAPFAIVIW